MRLSHHAVIAALALAVRTTAPAQTMPIQRTVRGTTVTSTRMPAARIQVPTTARYVGAHRWLLFDVADCEVHVFVEADSARRVQRLYYVQFESYLPSHAGAYQDHANDVGAITKGGFHFGLRPNFGRSDEPTRPGSEPEHVFRLVRDAGYVLPAHFANLRLMTIVGPQRRHELIIYYIEDLAPSGYTSDRLVVDSAKRIIAPAWATISADMQRRALAAIQVTRR
jgi:hypothetical protein